MVQEVEEDDLAPTDVGGVESAKYVAHQFLDELHYRKLTQILATGWNRMHSLSAAMKLMEQYGVTLAPEEVEELAHMDEAKQIEALVTKMPAQNDDQFRHFFLQLQLLVSTAATVRQALEQGRSDSVEDALSDAEKTGIAPYILRMAIVQAGSEVAGLRTQYEAWVKDADKKMGKLIRGQEDAIIARQKLAAAEAVLHESNFEMSEKIKKTLMIMCGSSDSAILASSFVAWRDHCKAVRIEAEIYAEYRHEIEFAEGRLIHYMEKQLVAVRAMMEKRAQAKLLELFVEVFFAYKDQVAYEKDVRLNADRVKDLEAQLAMVDEAQAERVKGIISKMMSDNSHALIDLAWDAWRSFCEDYKKNRVVEEAVKSSEQNITRFLQGKSEDAQKLLMALGGESDSVCIKLGWESWMKLVADAKHDAALANMLDGSKSALERLSFNGKNGAKIALRKAELYQTHGLLLQTLNAWRLDARLDRTLRQSHNQIEAKRMQLTGVQKMFRNFAVQLEAGLREGNDSARDMKEMTGPPVRTKKGMQKNEGSVSLPQIHQKPEKHRQSGGTVDAHSRPDKATRSHSGGGHSGHHSQAVAHGYPNPAAAAEDPGFRAGK